MLAHSVLFYIKNTIPAFSLGFVLLSIAVISAYVMKKRRCTMPVRGIIINISREYEWEGALGIMRRSNLKKYKVVVLDNNNRPDGEMSFLSKPIKYKINDKISFFSNPYNPHEILIPEETVKDYRFMCLLFLSFALILTIAYFIA